MANKGKSITVDPIRTVEEIRFIERLLQERPRDLALFVFGINSNLRASDLLNIKVRQVRHITPGEAFQIKERKTGKTRLVTINGKMHKVIQPLLAYLSDDQHLFSSRKGAGAEPMATETLNRLVKRWSLEAKLKGNFGSHTLRKTWAYTQYRHFGAELPDLMEALNHSSQKETLRYIGIEQKRVKNLFMMEV